MKVLKYLLLVTLLVLTILPAAAVGARDNDGPKDNPHFGDKVTATLKVTKLGEGTVTPIGDDLTTCKWLVKDRPAEGTVTGFFTGTWKFTYSGILNHDQSGIIAGHMTVNSKNGSIEGPIMDTVTAPQFAGVNPVNGQVVLLAEIKGCKVFLVNGKGGLKNIDVNGQLDGKMYLQMDATSTHVQSVLNGEMVFNPYTNQMFAASSVLTLTGKTAKSLKR